MTNLLAPRRVEPNVLGGLAAGSVVVHVVVGGPEEGLPEAGVAAVVVGVGLLRPHGVDPVGDARTRQSAPRRRLADAPVDAGIADGCHRPGVEVHVVHGHGWFPLGK